MRLGRLGIVAIFIVLIVKIISATQIEPQGLDRRGEWLSWSDSQRATYVDGFITGYLQGSHSACEAADELFEVDKPHTLGDQHHPSDVPSARCLARMEDYSKVKYSETMGSDFGAYTNVITEFYSKHPDASEIPFVNLMKALSDRNYKTADQLYQSVLKGELRPLR